MNKEEYFDALRRRWSHKGLRSAALMTYLGSAVDDADADRQLRESGRGSLSRMLEAGVLSPNLTVYEIGSGCGRVATALAPYLSEGRYVGVDLSAQYVGIARSRCPEGTFKVTDGYSFPLPDASADLVIEFAIFCHMPLQQIWKWLVETKRVLRPGGRTYIQFHNVASDNKWAEFAASADSWRFLEDPGHPRAVTWDTVALLFSRAGLRVEAAHEADRDAGGPRSWFVVAVK